MSKNNNVQIKKSRKPMSPQAKRNLANIFGSIISNQRAIDGAKEMPIWVAIIFLLLSVFLPVIPMMVQTSNSYGSSFVNTYSYGLDVTLPELSYQAKQNGFEFKVTGEKENMQLISSTPLDVKYKTEPIAKYENKMTNEYNLFMYYSDVETTDEIKSLITACSSDHYIRGTTIKAGSDVAENIYTPSFIILHKTRLYVCLYTPSTTTAITSSYEGCNWNHFDASVTNSLFDRVLSDADHSQIVYFNEKVFKNWKTVFDESYLQQKDYALLTNTFIYMGIYLGLIIFMGLMIFLLTRGKKNVYHYLSFLTCEKIASWASFTPALLGLILGFIFPSQSVLFFIMILGVRIMWLSMKQLRPQNY